MDTNGPPQKKNLENPGEGDVCSDSSSVVISLESSPFRKLPLPERRKQLTEGGLKISKSILLVQIEI